ncbi:CGNR zinc finger domain-containing protein [Nocardioides sp. WV_118_6]|uniref:CGNR zinc finger domain-containing protein n=1 Tax=Pimelobacter TaxID=2044 RepID=UPI00214FB997|nr:MULTISPECIES: CGNR zinc finger domain-containing protein [Pimelobacter]UUW89030.1 CGNR zinc finger domain-containing protein [Pimelobacter simplex]UUW98534.1 CGNR zinc finger domain-containing protein [Pimelobacter simplex]
MLVKPYARPLLDVMIGLLNEPPADADEVAARWVAAGMPLESRPRESDLAVVGACLAAWARMVDAVDEAARVVVLNELLARYAGPPTVTDHDGSGWHVHHRPDDASLGEILAASSAVAAADHLTAHGMHRLGRCALDECGRAFADHSRPGRQRYCSHACANRDAVRRHRRARSS